MKIKFTFNILFLTFLASCSSSAVRYYNVVGADQLVCDSYKIREGKQAILELEGQCIGELPCDAMDEQPNVIENDDTLNIVVYHPTRKDLMDSFQFINEKLGGFRVREGKIDLPDITPVVVEGLNLREAQEKIEKQFQEHIHDVRIFATYKDRHKGNVDLTGVVGTASVPVDGRTRLFEVISKARANTPSVNWHMSYVSREETQLPIDLHRLIAQGDMSQNIVMKGGDKIFLANISDATVMILGEVGSPTLINVPSGTIPLKTALATAKGIAFTGNRNNIQVVRGNLSNPIVYVLCWEHVVNLPNDSLLLMPGDMVYISETPITQWNRFIEQLLPTQQAYRGCRN